MASNVGQRRLDWALCVRCCCNITESEKIHLYNSFTFDKQQKTIKKNYILLINTQVAYGKSSRKNPAYGKYQLSRPMRIVGPIQFWRGCVIYRSAPKSGLGPRENADSVHAKVGTRSTQKC